MSKDNSLTIAKLNNTLRIERAYGAELRRHISTCEQANVDLTNSNAALTAERDALAAQLAACVEVLRKVRWFVPDKAIDAILANLPAAAQELLAERDALRERLAQAKGVAVTLARTLSFFASTYHWQQHASTRIEHCQSDTCREAVRVLSAHEVLAATLEEMRDREG